MNLCILCPVFNFTQNAKTCSLFQYALAVNNEAFIRRGASLHFSEPPGIFSSVWVKVTELHQTPPLGQRSNTMPVAQGLMSSMETSPKIVC